MVHSEYTRVEENQDKKHEFYPMETTTLIKAAYLAQSWQF